MKNLLLFGVIRITALDKNIFCQTQNKIDVKVTGTGVQSIIFIPDYACSGDVWSETVNNIKQDFTCYVLTMPGTAGVPAIRNASFGRWESYIAEFMFENNIKHAIIIGHGLGGGLALALAADYPKYVKKVVVVDDAHCYAAISDTTLKSIPYHDCDEVVECMATISDSNFYKRTKLDVSFTTTDTAHTTQLVDWAMKSDRRTLAEIGCDLINVDLRCKITVIEAPALILLEQYAPRSKKAIETQYKNLKTAELYYSTKGMHFIMYEDAAWFNEKLKDFIYK